MNNIPAALRAELAADPYYRHCAYQDVVGRHFCEGRITWEHALYFQGVQIQKRFAILPLCEKAHGIGRFMDAGDLDKRINQWIALNRATDAELRAISKAVDYIHHRDYLNRLYGPYSEPQAELPAIAY
ncbi:MAG: hypothetical protein J0H89_12160 [Rhizobiales bacterium]|nr:hypothetical protein [Hyphomicrobiales bacterium]